MLAQQRQDRILDLVRTTGGARVSELVGELGVSDMTVRRDIEVLAERGLVARVHGGATAVGSSVAEPGFAAKAELHTEAKQAIARVAAELVPEGSAVALSAGTTTRAVAQALTTTPGLTVVTNSVRVAEVFWSGTTTVVLTGGERTPSDALVGPVAQDALERLRVDILLIGTHGMSTEAGLTTPNLAEARTNRALVSGARRVVVVADCSKWGVVGLSRFAGLDEVDTVVTDAGLPAAGRTALQQAGVRVVTA